MSAVAERGGPKLIVTPQESFDNVTRSVGVDLATRLVPAWNNIGHGIALLATSDVIHHERGPDYIGRIEKGFISIVETVTTLATPEPAPQTAPPSPLVDGVDVIVGESAAHFVGDFGHRIHTLNTSVRGFGQLTGRMSSDMRAIQAAELIVKGADIVEEEAGKFRSPKDVSPPQADESPKKQPYIDRVVVERTDGKITTDVVLAERDLLPEPPRPLILLPTSPAATIYELVPVESVA